MCFIVELVIRVRASRPVAHNRQILASLGSRSKHLPPKKPQGTFPSCSGSPYEELFFLLLKRFEGLEQNRALC